MKNKVLLVTAGLFGSNFLERLYHCRKDYNPSSDHPHVYVLNGVDPDRDILLIKDLQRFDPNSKIYFVREVLGDFHSKMLGLSIIKYWLDPEIAGCHLIEEDYIFEPGFNYDSIQKYLHFPIHFISSTYKHFNIEGGTCGGYKKLNSTDHHIKHAQRELDESNSDFYYRLDRLTIINMNNEGYYFPKNFEFDRKMFHEIFRKLLYDYTMTHVPNDEFITHLTAFSSSKGLILAEVDKIFHQHESKLPTKSNFDPEDPKLFYKNYNVEKPEDWHLIELDYSSKLNLGEFV